MSYVIQAVLSNAQHPEYGQVTIPFPIPNQNYDCTIELLEPLEIGDTLRQDCQVDELDSFYTVLNALIGTQVTLDELDYLAKRLDSFDDGEAAQFQGMAHKLGLSKIKDLINLTFCCQKATVITDFSDLEKIGREHYMNLNGGCARTEDLEALDGTETAYLLIDSGAGTVTPYGVAYDNSMKLEPLYNGRQFPEYLYDNSSMGLKIVPAENQAPELLWLPASEQQIRRTLLRAGWQDPDHADYTIDVFLLQKEAGRILNEKRDSLHSLNAMCGAIAKLEQKDRDKLEAVIVFAEPENAGAIRRLAENLEQFDFIPGIHTPEEYGRYMIRESGRFEYDDTARWATKQEIRQTYAHVPFEPELWRKGEHLPEKQGLVLGCEGPKDHVTALVDTDDIHAMVTAASGAGKTAFFLYPNIEYALASGMSFLCTDTKGDLFRNYAGIAKDCYGYQIAVLDLRTGLIYLQSFAPDMDLQEFEERVCCVMENRMLVDVIDRALLRLKRYPDRGELYYEILTKQFIHRFNSTEKELLDELNMERSVFYDRKREAIFLLSLCLFGYAVPELQEELEMPRLYPD